MYTVEEFDRNKTKVMEYILYKKRTEYEVRKKFCHTIEENMLEDIIEYIKAMQRCGNMEDRFVVRPKKTDKKEDKSVVMTLRMERELQEEFDHLSAKSDRSRNELMCRALRYALEHCFKRLIIYHDYEGIAKWCQGDWKTNRDGTKAYREYYDSIRGRVDISFVKVAGHSGDKYNDMADALAKQALGIEA